MTEEHRPGWSIRPVPEGKGQGFTARARRKGPPRVMWARDLDSLVQQIDTEEDQ
jgi:hypothetical protein